MATDPGKAGTVAAPGGSDSGARSGPATSARRGGVSWSELAERFGLLVVLVALIVVFGVSNSVFMTKANWQSIFSSQSVVLVIALALMVPLVAGNFDLSVGSVTILASIAVAGAQQNNHAGLLLAIIIGIACGTVIGIVNGILVTRFRLNALIATLGTSVVVTGLIEEYTRGNSIVNGISTSITNFGSTNVASIPKLAIVAVVAAILVAYLLTKTPYGRKLSAIGSSQDAAKLVGIRTDRVVFTSFVVSGTVAGIAGVMLLAQQGSGNPAANGISLLIPALAAVYLGASTLFPGRFNVPGTILGLILVAVLVSGLTLEGVAPWVQPVAQGSALIIAVGFSEAFRRQRQ